eukprot:jgi/Bigna1/85916/estExt_fgenesh1_pg.C_70017
MVLEYEASSMKKPYCSRTPKKPPGRKRIRPGCSLDGHAFVSKKSEIIQRKSQSKVNKNLEDTRKQMLNVLHTHGLPENAIPIHLFRTLFSFQLEGIVRIVSKFNGNALLGDDMGLGKTLEALAVASIYKSDWPLLIVCPASVRKTWAEQLETWLHYLHPTDDIQVFSSHADTVEPGVRVCIISYRMLISCLREIRRVGWGFIIVDESQNLKRWSERTKAIFQLVRLPRDKFTLDDDSSLIPSRASSHSPASKKYHQKIQRRKGDLDALFPHKRIDGEKFGRVMDPLTTIGQLPIPQLSLEQRWQRQRAGSPPRVLLLSGTPCLDRPIDLYYQLALLCPDKLQTRWKTHEAFGDYFCSKYWFRLPNGTSQWQWGLGLPERLAELYNFLTDACLVRRLKQHVMANSLPVKNRILVRVSINPNKSNSNNDNNDKNNITANIPNKKQQQGANRQENRTMMRMSKRSRVVMDSDCPPFSCDSSNWKIDGAGSDNVGIAKIPFVVSYIVKLLYKKERRSNTKIVVFAFHISVIDRIRDCLRTYFYKHREGKEDLVCLKGCTPADTRHRLLKKFENDEVTRVAVLSIKAMGTGLNLSIASDVVFGELMWTPSELVQAEDRVHRYTSSCQQQHIKKKKKKHAAVCNMHYVCARGSKDEVMWRKILHKSTNISRCTNGGDSQDFRVQSIKDMVNYVDIVAASIKDSCDSNNGDGEGQIQKDGYNNGEENAVDDGEEDDDNNTGKNRYSSYSFSFKEERGKCKRRILVNDFAGAGKCCIRFVVSQHSGRLHVCDSRNRCLGSVNIEEIRSRAAGEADKQQEAVGDNEGKEMLVKCSNTASTAKEEWIPSVLSHSLRCRWGELKNLVFQFVVEWDSLKPIWQHRLTGKVLYLPLDIQVISVAAAKFAKEPLFRKGGGGGSKRRWASHQSFIENAPEDGRIEQIVFANGVIRSQIVLPDNTRLCLYCRNPLQNSLPTTAPHQCCKQPKSQRGRRRSDIQRLREMLCSRDCYSEYTLRVGTSSLVRARLSNLEEGICQSCNTDCRKLFHLVEALKGIDDRKKVLYAAGYNPSAIGRKRFKRLVDNERKITEGLFWEADHILEVARSGGECGMENYQTLCIPCHQRKTRQFMHWRANVVATSKNVGGGGKNRKTKMMMPEIKVN